MARYTLVSWLVVLSYCALLSGCLFQPGNGLVVSGTGAPITVAGTSGANDSEVIVLAARNASDPLVNVGVLPTNAQSEFSGSVSIPADLWSPACPGGDFETFVQVTLATGEPLITFDDPAVAGRTPQQCLRQEVFARGIGIAEAIAACSAEDSPIVRITTEPSGFSTEIDGNIVIDDPADANDLVCVERIDGTLTIDDRVVADVSLPALEEVTGDVRIVYERAMDTSVSTELVELPELTRIGGNLTLLAPRPSMGGALVTVQFGMPRLNSVGGDIVIDIESFNTTVRGLPALSRAVGNVSYSGGTADSTGSSLLPALAIVDGHLEVNFGNSTTQGYFQNVTSVGGDVRASGGLWIHGRNFIGLSTVGGSLHLSDIDFLGPPTMQVMFDSLASVAGVLDIDAQSHPVEEVGLSSVAIGGIRLNANTWLTDIGLSLAKFTLDPAGPITITDNPNQRECDAMAFVDGLVGHVGLVDISGNLVCSPM